MTQPATNSHRTLAENEFFLRDVPAAGALLVAEVRRALCS
jgi:hypothetical protein